MKAMLIKIAQALLAKLLTEKVMKSLLLMLLRKLAERSDNKIDDEVVKIIEDALEKPEEKK